MTHPHHKTCDVIMGAVVKPRRRLLLAASVGALVLHIGGAAAALTLANHPNVDAPRKSKPMVVIDHVVDLTPPKVEEPPPPPPPEAPPPPPPPPKVKMKIKEPVVPVPTPETPPPAPEPEKPPSEPPPAAQAAQVVAADNAAEGAFKVVTGSGSGYAGGTTTATGTGTQANHTGQIGTGNGNGVNHTRPPQVASRNWPCGWPPEAEELDLEETYVTLKAVVKANGELADVKVLQDPGYGFAKRAIWCARTKVRFDPALDYNGNKVDGETPPLRVKFERGDDY